MNNGRMLAIAVGVIVTALAIVYAIVEDEK